MFTLALYACDSSDENPAREGDWGVDSSDTTAMHKVTGTMGYQREGPAVGYAVKEAYLRQMPFYDTSVERYELVFHFEGQDSLRIILLRRTLQYEFHYPARKVENEVVMGVFNTDTLDVEESLISLKPQEDKKKFQVAASLHTYQSGDFSGMVSGVPYMKAVNE